MAQRSLSVTVSMPVEMDEKIADEAHKHGMSYSEYVRHILREHAITPFAVPDRTLEDRLSEQRERQEGAA